MFSVYGAVSSVRITGSSALITFEDSTPAYFAQLTLNGKTIPNMRAKIYVSWFSLEGSGWDELGTNSKHTCRYDIQIGNDKDF